ncbi:hypothetical protein HPB48_011102 [Haemaphysalis longicornis]|uniref:S-phase kinase-associated protein 1 n=1 Tax=Haemaphysalis longicornis TaxID=44386 RepID=A0A9J6G209_HAELO|nr:hypothetical protein HPB48_011102 [Haemaphysalis longicornis]
MPYIKLQGSDGGVFNVDVNIAKTCATLKIMLEDLGTDEDDGEAVELPNVRSEILGKVIEWATHHKDDTPRPEDDDESPTQISAWDKQFLDVDKSTLFDLMLAANYLHLPSLLDAASKMVADMMKGKTVAEIRATFNIINDFPVHPAELAAKRRKIEDAFGC